MAGMPGSLRLMGKGSSRKRTFSVTILAGKGSGNSVKMLSQNQVHFAPPDTGALVVGRSKGAKVKLVGIFHDKSMMSVFYLKKSGITRVSDLKGKTLGDAAWAAGPVLFPALALKHGLDPKSVKWTFFTPAAKGPSLLSGAVDAITTFVTDFPTYKDLARKSGNELRQLTFADNGMDIYSSGIATTDQRIRENPDLVRRFTHAIYKGIAWAVENPEKTVDYFVSRHPAVNRNLATKHWNITVDHLLTPIAMKNGIGYIDHAKMEFTKDMVLEARKLEKIPAGDIFTNKFLPKLFPKKP